MGTVSAVRQERFEKRYNGRWLALYRKKGTVVWPSVRMFGGSMSSDCFGGFLDQITAGKKGYSRLAIG
jgi:hypothetical protein